MKQDPNTILFLSTTSEDDMRFAQTDLDRLGHRLDVVRTLRNSIKSSWAYTYWSHVERQLLKKLKDANRKI